MLAESDEFAGDQTQPTAEILNALNSVKSEPQPDSLPTPTEYEALTAQLKQNPHNPEGWRRLIDLAENSGEIEKIRASFDALLQQYPNTSSAQIRYIGHFLNDQNTFGEAEDLFKKFLKVSPSVDLWKYYLIYVRRVNTGPSTRDTVRKSYEFALNHVGQDKDSGEIWRDYIQFLRSGETTTTWEEQQKMDALRKVYHRAVQIPLDNVEGLWQELEAFETNLNKITAKKFMADLSPAHMQARTTLRQLINHANGLYPSPPLYPTPPGRPDLFLPSLPTFNPSERMLVGKWKAYLKWEESNPLEIEEKDRAVLTSRIQGVYRKAVIRMRYYTEIWFMAYTWSSSVGKHEEAMSILRAGMEANPTSFLLTFAYAEAQESKKEFQDVHATYDKFLSALRADLEVLEARTKATEASFTSNGSAAPAIGGVVAPTGITEAGTSSQNSSFNTQSSDEKPPKSSELAERRTEYGLAYIVYMRFGRRAEGVKSSRAIFGKARKDRWAPWEVYEAAALMEYHCSDDKSVASRIFEKGLDLFGDEIEYVLRYLGFLISINDENNARALFERVIGTFPPERARPLWERWARYEYQYGDLDAAQKLEKRIAEVYPTDPPIKRFAQRHIYLGTDAIAARDLGFAMARKATAQPLVRNETPQSLIASSSTANGGISTSAHKRPSSPDYRKREDRGSGGDYSQGHKRARPLSPAPAGRGERDRDRDRWEPPPPPSRRRFSPPTWERERESRDRPPPPSRVQEREEEKPRVPVIPPVISWFVGDLPAPGVFDGPVFRTEDLMNLFRNAVIPSSGGGARVKSPPPAAPPRGGGRPPPDYGPYQGPGGGRTGRRY
ncbi:mRNA 3'-end-processing protein RNA14 [Hypsizygus marmoreus]|uniref:mRNA 3'-end-processing protein RNA14 n=1 Tax=Hypsizygus marmoreus TaxID=39966 RepID=A0A369JIG9_HYPMA|nr:mRNA 3'-end-processing protein RNA14 [Hypsizygus marmoreus]